VRILSSTAWSLSTRLQESPAVNPFIDPDGYRKFIDDSEKAYLEELTQEMNP
jgi:hypothetical protein